MVGDIAELFPMPDRHAATGLLLVEEGLDQQRSREDLVAWAVEEVGAWYVSRADGFALAAAQAVLDRARDRADVGLLHDQRLVPEQVEARRIGAGEIAPRQQLALVEAALGVDARLVGAQFGGLVLGEELELGDADAVLAGDHAAELAGDAHDAHHGGFRLLQHQVVVGVDRDVGVHVAIARMHVQRHPDAALQHALVDGGGFGADRRKGVAGEQRSERIAQFALPGHAQRAILQAREERRIVEPVQQIGPMVAHLCDEAQRPGRAVAQDLLARQRVELGVSGLAGLERTAQELLERVGKAQLVGDRELDVDAFDGIGVVPETRQRDHHVFVDLEGVGVFGDRGGACAVEPELPACVGTDGDEALAAAAVGDADGLAGGARHGGVIFADDVADQHHLGQRAALALGDVADRLEVALIEVLEPRELDAVGTVRGVETSDDLDDRGDRLARFAEEFETYRAHVPRHVMHHPARCGDEAIAAFFLHAGQSAQELVGDILAETGLAER